MTYLEPLELGVVDELLFGFLQRLGLRLERLFNFFSFQRLVGRGQSILFFLMQVDGAGFFGHEASKNTLAEIVLKG